MVDGDDVYRDIKSRVNSLESEVSSIDRDFRNKTDELRGYEIDREETYVNLAQFYLPEMDAQAIDDTFKSMQSEIESIFDKKKDRVDLIDNSIIDSMNTRRKLEEELEVITTSLQDLEVLRDNTVEIVLDNLGENETYVLLKKETDYAQEKYIRDDETYSNILNENGEKLIAYHNNSIFMYLFNKDFSRSKSNQEGIIGKIDSWIANHINYEDQKKNCDYLLGAPDVMKEVLEKDRENLEKGIQRLQEIESATEIEFELDKIRKEGNNLLSKRNAILSNIDNNDRNYSNLEQERISLESTRGKYWGEAVDRIKNYLEGQSISDLMEKARVTPSRKDDDLVSAIEQLNQLISNNSSELELIGEKRYSLAEKLDGLKEVRRKFSNNDYESRRSEFGYSFDVDNLIDDYLSGGMSSDGLWGEIDSEQSFRARRSSYSSSSYSSSSSSSSSSWGGGGGFSGGGGFGGGGFSSGGGF